MSVHMSAVESEYTIIPEVIDTNAFIWITFSGNYIFSKFMMVCTTNKFLKNKSTNFTL